MLSIRGRQTRPLVQGGMGVGVSAHRLAGAVARQGCVGTISSVDLRRLHPDLMLATGRSRDRQAIESANLVAQYPGYVRQACKSGADAIVVGAGLPARAVRTPWLARYLEKEAALQRRAKPRRECTLAFDCLAQCGLRDGNPRMGQFCIDHHLAAALHGDVDHGLFFRGSESVPFGGQIRPVRELAEHLLGARVH